jgi:two-component system, OmpR family, phosphate regulon sensor histidine kinase PhoR
LKRPSVMRRLFEWRLTAFRIALIYAILGALWILLSDTLLGLLVRDPETLTRLSTLKGWLFILVTAWLLNSLIRRSMAEIHRSEEQLHERTSELEALQEETQEERNRLQVLVDTAPVGIVVHSAPNGRGILLSNAAAEIIIGRPLAADEDISNQSTYYGIHRPTGESFPPDQLPVSCALRGEACVGVEMLIHQPSGHQVYVLANSAPIRDARGEITGALVAFQDITPIKEQERLRDEFLSAAAHELKTPVTTIKGYVQMMQRWASGGRDHREAQALEVINTQCDRINLRVLEMLEAVRSHVAPLEPPLECFDLGELTSQVIQRMQGAAQLNQLILERQGPAQVQADRERIEEVLVSLVDNAVRYSPEDGETRVRVWVQDGNVLVSVKDQGLGISEERRRHVFEPFYEPVPSGSPGYLGVVPLGLYLSKLIIERYQGHIWLDSEAGKGSTFCFSLPSASERSDSAQRL